MIISVHGLLVIDKPAGVTSREAVNRVQGWFPRGTRIGHTGTLDPLATGVLVLCLGPATRLAEFIQELGKVYLTRVRLGARSSTGDAEGVITPLEVTQVPTAAEVDQALESLVGWIDQVPPAYSAVKVGGRRAYELARRGRPVALKPRRIYIESIHRLAFTYPHLDLEVACGEGTYIRSLAADLGDRLGCGGYVESLRRTRVGPFRAEDGLPLEASASMVQARRLPPAAAFPGATLVLDAANVRRLHHGQTATLPLPAGGSVSAQRLAVLDENNQFVAVCAVEVHDNRLALRPIKVIPAGLI